MILIGENMRFMYVLLFTLSCCYGCNNNEFKAFGHCFKRKYFTKDHAELIQHCSFISNLDKTPCQDALHTINFLIDQNKKSFKIPFLEFSYGAYMNIKQHLEDKIEIIKKHTLPEALPLWKRTPTDDIRVDDIRIFEKYYQKGGTLSLAKERFTFDPEEMVKEIQQCREFAVNKKVCLLWIARIDHFEWNYQNRKFNIEEDNNKEEWQTSTMSVWRNARYQIKKSLSHIKKLKQVLRGER
jgi:hypothetical protein